MHAERIAAHSWLALRDSFAPMQLLVLGMVEQDAYCDPQLRVAGLRCLSVANCLHSLYKIPTVTCVVEAAFSVALKEFAGRETYFLLVNSDIVFTRSLPAAVLQLRKRMPVDLLRLGSALT